MELWQIIIENHITQNCGIRVDYDCDKGSITLSAPKHVERFLEILDFTDCNPSSTPYVVSHDMRKLAKLKRLFSMGKRRFSFASLSHIMAHSSAELHNTYRYAVGVSRFTSYTVRHEIAYMTIALAAHQDSPTDRHYNALKRLGLYLRGNPNLGVAYSKKASNSPPHLGAWLDADWATFPDTCKSRKGYLFTFFGDDLAWRAYLQKSHALLHNLNTWRLLPPPTKHNISAALVQRGKSPFAPRKTLLFLSI